MKQSLMNGELCSVNTLESGQIYIIKEINNFQATLVYFSGTQKCTTTCDIDSLHKPTSLQMKHEFNQDTLEAHGA